ncbi:MAG TPA: hypothetical protein HPQ03_16600 [Deltaproteobacteria bacterium]|nr:hypothetical protein [Deltaproteobacteria bacterium]
MSKAAVIIGTGVVFFLATCWAIIDIARKDFGGIEKKALWGFITLIPFIGPIVYFSIGFRKGKKSRTLNSEP